MKVYFRNFGRIMMTACFGLVLRALAICPCAAAVFGGDQKEIGLVLLFLTSITVWILLVMPFRVYHRVSFRELFGRTAEKPGYVSALKTGLRRVGKGLAYGFPLYILAALWYYGYHVVNFKAFYSFIKDLGAFFGGRADTGLIVTGICMLAAALVYAVGWWLYTPADYMSSPVPLRKARKFLVSHIRSYALCLVQNILLVLPSVLLWSVILYSYYKNRIVWTGSALSLLQNVTETLKTPLPGSILLRLFFVLAVVHVPLCAFRKLRTSELTCLLERDDRAED